MDLGNPARPAQRGGRRQRQGSELDGPESVRNVVVATDRVHSYLTGLLAGLGTLLADRRDRTVSTRTPKGGGCR